MTPGEKAVYEQALKSIQGWRPPQQASAAVRRLYEPSEPHLDFSPRVGKGGITRNRERRRASFHATGHDHAC